MISIRAHVNSPDPISRELCASALGSMGPAAKAARGDLGMLMSDEDALVRFAAKQALQRVDAPEQD